MTQILSGGTTGDSLLNLTIPIFITENTTDIGIYSVFDGMVIQQETMTNFLFSSTTQDPYRYYFYNTSDVEFKKYLSFSDYKIDWGDGSPQITVNNISPSFYNHTYTQSGNFIITMSGMSPWGVNLIKKEISVPYSAATISNPKGTAHFLPAGGSWSATPLNYNYIFSGDSICDVDVQGSEDYTVVPFTISGYTKSTMNDLEVYGSKYNPNLFDGRFRKGETITANTETIGTFWGPSDDGLYTAYTVNDITYFDYPNGTTVFFVESSGLTSNMLVCSAITKDELLMNVIDEPVAQSDVLMDRGKQSGLEGLIRIGEVDNVGDLLKYGYGFFKVNET